MKMIFTAAALALLPASAVAAPAADWRNTVVQTSEGGMAIGNPKAKVALVEYASLTCPHCREFAKAGVPPLLANYVKSGTVRYEYRSFLLNGYDIAATLIARCAGPKRFFPAADRIFTEQPKWIARAQSAPPSRLESIKGLPREKQVPAMAEIAGLKAYGVASGIPAARIDQCLADKAETERLIGYARKANQEKGVNATPTFFINGAKASAHDWASLEPLIKKAL